VQITLAKEKYISLKVSSNENTKTFLFLNNQRKTRNLLNYIKHTIHNKLKKKNKEKRKRKINV
jgi:hypothetical protein